MNCLILLDLGFLSDEELRELCYESLKEIFPQNGAMALIQRSKIWKIISKPVCSYYILLYIAIVGLIWMFQKCIYIASYKYIILL